jgi:hypothetical protein
VELQTIYLRKLGEAVSRLGACDFFLSVHQTSKDVYSVEAAVIQVRKAFEAVAFAAIAPNKKEYEAFRANAEHSPITAKTSTLEPSSTIWRRSIRTSIRRHYSHRESKPTALGTSSDGPTAT